MKKINESKNSKKFNATINKVHEEMEKAEKNILNWNVNWKETYSEAYCYDLQYLTEDEIAWLESLYDGKYDLTNGGEITSRVGAALERERLFDDNNDEYLCEFRRIEWLVSNNKVGRVFNYGNMGDISYSQIKRNRKDSDESYDYYAKYNVNDNSLAIRFVRCNEDLTALFEGEKRVIESDGIHFMEDSNGCELSVQNGTKNFVVTMDTLNRIDSKILIDNEDTFVICGDEVISATRRVDDEDVSLEITEKLVTEVNEKLKELQIGLYNKYELLTLIASMKARVINAMKAVKNDVPLVGLGRRLDIAMAMVNAKSAPKEDNTLKKQKKNKK